MTRILNWLERIVEWLRARVEVPVEAATRKPPRPPVKAPKVVHVRPVPRPAPEEVPEEVVIETPLAWARVLMTEQDTRWPERSGEAKRHQVLARLKKDFPEARTKALAYVIEQVIQERP